MPPPDHGHLYDGESAATFDSHPDGPKSTSRGAEPAVGERQNWKSLLRRRIGNVLGELLLASLAINVLSLATPLFMMAVFNRVIGHHSPDSPDGTMVTLMAGLGLAYLFDLGLRILRGYTSSHTGARVDSLLSGEIVRHVLRLPYQYFERTPSGLIAERLRQLDTLRAFFTGHMPSLIIDLAFAALCLVAIVAISQPIGLAVLLMMPVFGGISVLTHRAQRRHVEESFEALAAKGSMLNETVGNAGTIKALGLEAEMEHRWGTRVARAAWTGFRANNLVNVVTSLTGSLQLFAGLGVILLGVQEVAAQRLSIGALVAVSMLAARALTPMRQVVSTWHTIQSVRAAFRHVDDMMREPAESEAGDPAALAQIAGEIVFDGVSFRHTPDAPQVLQDVELHIEPGTIVGIVGPSGSGKTTLANLLQGLYRASSGRVLIDGTEISRVPPAQLRAQIGCVPQDAQLFSGTVLENMAMGAAGKDPARLVAIARLVGAHGFIQRLPRGYNTMLGERGSGLSAGQKQLICIVRAMVRNPRIIVLDEATSALDPATEEQFLRALRANARGRTVVIITHRLAPLAIADKVALVINGRVERCGSPADVMAYARIRMAEVSRGQPASPALAVVGMPA